VVDARAFQVTRLTVANGGFLGFVWIILAASLSLGNVHGQQTSSLMLMVFSCFFIIFSPLSIL
jgi:hypothetical protein